MFFDNKSQIAVAPMFGVGNYKWLSAFIDTDIIPGIFWDDAPGSAHQLTTNDWDNFFSKTNQVIIAISYSRAYNKSFLNFIKKYKPRYIELFPSLSNSTATFEKKGKLLELFKSLNIKSYIKYNGNPDDDRPVSNFIDLNLLDGVCIKTSTAAGRQPTLSMEESIEYTKLNFPSHDLLAAGAITTKEDILNFKELGFSGFLAGSIFAFTEESNIHPNLKKVVVDKKSTDLSSIENLSVLTTGSLNENDNGNLSSNWRNARLTGTDGITFMGNAIDNITKIQSVKDICESLFFVNYKNPEQIIYQDIYECLKDGYGGSDIFSRRTSHTSNLHASFAFMLKDKQKKITNFLDVGCGNNYFVKYLREKLEIDAWGIDFACSKADQIADILDLPFKDKEWEWLSAWDVLEHLRPEQIDNGLKEMARVSKYFAFTINRSPTVTRKPHLDYQLHQTLWSLEKWKEHIERLGKINSITTNSEYEGELYIGKWNN